ncbi:MAG TPA: hypothetical protein VD838_12485, partial [Anaeromyxobacteraceae bacterium]|nr:hypothetical protein [Anaeromyxobacteraceae bacterium]
SEYSETYPGFGTDVWEDEALALGLHFGGGMSAHLTRNVSVGAEVKYVVAEAELYDYDTGLDSLLVGATLDFAF